MERLALSLWTALTLVTLAGSLDTEHGARAPRGFPKLPVPAGAMLTEAPLAGARRSFQDGPILLPNHPSCSRCVPQAGDGWYLEAGLS